MTDEFINFEQLSRSEWQKLHQQSNLLLTEKELEAIKSLNDRIDTIDVQEIYLPLISLIEIYKRSRDNLAFAKSIFLKKKESKSPFIIGISGSVAVGKSTTSRLLQLLLARTFPNKRVSLVTTDGFLYPNITLKKKGILNRKGFPESYDMERLLNFLDAIKNTKKAYAPIYSHEIYDVLPNRMQTIADPDFLIIEGINVFQNQQNNRLYISDYFDFSIYIDADSRQIEKWYLERFESLLELAKKDKTNYYHRFTTMSKSAVLSMARDIWKTINLVNLENYIEPTRNRAEVILHKANNHKIDKIFLKK
ncbi:type I pantothenate kinase [Streptococcus sciuri]|uniref:Pantothenate kinase n=1 Tax=Streptococcus sciuri TaxID=2973939 RepID=A0ABT2F592_9STRE|nr:type I pantothenate kinase [Streptococcus sciuri]MCS4487645.1 type I pantothenate kinase [Streptococcus sciuri]